MPQTGTLVQGETSSPSMDAVTARVTEVLAQLQSQGTVGVELPGLVKLHGNELALPHYDHVERLVANVELASSYSGPKQQTQQQAGMPKPGDTQQHDFCINNNTTRHKAINENCIAGLEEAPPAIKARIADNVAENESKQYNLIGTRGKLAESSPSTKGPVKKAGVAGAWGWVRALLFGVE
ncbi:hypothetical protein M406DRAFT_354245 [Cryphonectria parasitica EP155]|uniref:Uncharacterized protein n=1 Tax=Cryphonectria parasitica (strain ATCC 38755 / EP155) TaxID=660469 RepID=A0A9P5CU33_CRYP1|nr:uncharacterized protein M406DRAFT_354245 [Cryphonectria parasitica EP155]KAF3770076.1 hypothetical protein M406DRAFT_354245 [Cryphonectria parasitica EP155]